CRLVCAGSSIMPGGGFTFCRTSRKAATCHAAGRDGRLWLTEAWPRGAWRMGAWLTGRFERGSGRVLTRVVREKFVAIDSPEADDGRADPCIFACILPAGGHGAGAFGPARCAAEGGGGDVHQPGLRLLPAG